MCNNTSSLVTLGHIGKITMYITRSACNTEMIFNILAPTFYCTCMIKKNGGFDQGRGGLLHTALKIHL